MPNKYRHEARASLLASGPDDAPDRRSVSPSSYSQSLYPANTYRAGGKFDDSGWKDDYAAGPGAGAYARDGPYSHDDPYAHSRPVSDPFYGDGDGDGGGGGGGGQPFAQQPRYIADPVVAAPGGYAQREGYIAGSPAKVKSDGLLSGLRYWPTSNWQWFFVTVVLGQAICGLALECYVVGTFQVNIIKGVDFDSIDATVRTVTVYLSLFIFGYLYQILLTYDALRMKNTIQLIGLCIYNAGLLVEAALELDQVHDAVNLLILDREDVDPDYWAHIQGFIIAVPCVMALGTALMIFGTWKLYTEFAWSIYKDISADLRLKRRFLAYQIYIALLKFDLFFFLAFTVQFLVVVTRTQDFETGLTVAAIPITVILLFLAAYWVQRESLGGMVMIIFFYFAGMAYFVFKLVRMYYGPADRIMDYLPARRALTTFAFITILLLLVTTGYAIWCTSNFNQGLKDHIGRGSKGRAAKLRRAASVDLNTMYAGAHGEPVLVGGPGTRITID